MIKREQVAVVVPTYKSSLSELEKISLLQLFKILGKYDVYFAIPQSLQADYLKQAMIERFEDCYFADIVGYNRFMLSGNFYRRFQKYKFILIYQLDAFVFSDRLLQFCNLEYDYIGAPWLTGMGKKVGETYLYQNVGNGGFSLRNVPNTIRLLDSQREELKTYCDSEDKFFAFCSSLSFKIAPVHIALQFAFEREVRRCYEQNNFMLPFGCHAWERYDYSFWKPYIEREGFLLPVKTPESGKEDEKNFEIYQQDGFIEKFWTFHAKPSIENRKDRKIAIFGTGMYGKRVLEILENAGISVECFIDNNKEIQGEYKSGYVVQSPDKLNRNDDFFIIIAISGSSMEHVSEQLNAMGKIYKMDYITYMDLIS